mgnify:CR=1 FL=1
MEPSGEDVKIDWHGHRDRGMGLANTFAALQAGFREEPDEAKALVTWAAVSHFDRIADEDFHFDARR